MAFATHGEARRIAEGALRPLWISTGSYVLFGADEWQGWGTANSPSSSVANSNGILMAVPWTCRKDITVSGLSVAIAAAAAAGSGSLVRMGLYDDTGTYGQPGALIADAGSAGIESTGLKDLAFASNYQMIRGNTYWNVALWLMAGATNATISQAATGRGSWKQGIDFVGNNNWDNESNFLYAPAQSTTALPSTCPTLVKNALGAIQRPFLGAKIVSMP